MATKRKTAKKSTAKRKTVAKKSVARRKISVKKATPVKKPTPARKTLTLYPTLTVVIRKKNYKCRAKDSSCEVDVGYKVQWYGRKVNACVVFKKVDWPFAEAYVAKIDVPNGGYSAKFTAKPVAAKFDGDYQYYCRPCSQSPGPGGPGGARIIIDP